MCGMRGQGLRVGEGFDKVADPVQDQWTYHAVAAAVRGHSLLRSFPGVDANRIGVTGISWGGYLTAVLWQAWTTVSLMRCRSTGAGSLATTQPGSPTLRRWAARTPANGLLCGTLLFTCRSPRCRFFGWTAATILPIPWIRCRAIALAKVRLTLCVRLRMPHGHGPAGENPKEILTFAGHFTADDKPPAGVHTTPLSAKVAK